MSTLTLLGMFSAKFQRLPSDHSSSDMSLIDNGQTVAVGISLKTLPSKVSVLIYSKMSDFRLIFPVYAPMLTCEKTVLQVVVS